MAVYQPIGPDLFILGEGGLGLNASLAALVALVGTVLGAMAAYWLGRHLGFAVLTRLFGVKERRLRKGERLYNRYGLWAVAIAAVSPIPLREICWLAGVFRMSFRAYLCALMLGLVPRFFGEAIFGTWLSTILS
ncbi:MAG: YqaA family protein [bacterium]